MKFDSAPQDNDKDEGRLESAEDPRTLFDAFAREVGDTVDVDGYVRFKTWNDANEFALLAKERGIAVEILDPVPERPGMTDFYKMMMTEQYRVKPVEGTK